ncbi:hypothetical protein C8R44DRAFT_889244 [Mycena epipterygia]|nr:hypothetical protein C8R44DRAFT_889244 [Mycena epipterygia]
MASVSSAWAIFGLPTTLAQVSSPTAFSRSLTFVFLTDQDCTRRNFKQLEVYEPVCAGCRADDGTCRFTIYIIRPGKPGPARSHLTMHALLRIPILAPRGPFRMTVCPRRSAILPRAMPFSFPSLWTRFKGLLMLFVDRLTAILWLTFSLAMIGVFGKWGARLQNALGTFNFGILAGIALLGLLSLVGVPRFVIRPGYKTPHKFASWDALWSGSRSDPNSLVTALYNIIWSFIGYSNANYALPEVKDPVRTIKRAAPLAIQPVAAVYMLVNIAVLFFCNLFGPAIERALSAERLHRALRALHARLIQELGREGIFPFSAFFTSSKPLCAPLAVLYAISVTMVIAPPPGDAYLFLLSMSSDLPFRVPRVVVALFFAANVFLTLALAPLLPPALGQKMFKHIPYYMHFVVTLAGSQLGIYWSTSTLDSDQTAPPGDSWHRWASFESELAVCSARPHPHRMYHPPGVSARTVLSGSFFALLVEVLERPSFVRLVDSVGFNLAAGAVVLFAASVTGRVVLPLLRRVRFRLLLHQKLMILTEDGLNDKFLSVHASCNSPWND